MRRRRPVVCALAVAAALVFAASASAGDDQDSAWPESDAAADGVRAVRAAVSRLEDEARLMQLSVARYAGWEQCLRGVPVTEYGDPDRQSGYVYDERDGSGRGHMPALAVDRTRRDGSVDYLFLDFARTPDCRSNAPVPGGTADAASVPRARAAGGGLRGLERRVEALKRTVRRLEAASERFDEWSSCISWVPVTEYGDPDGGFGFVFGDAAGAGIGFRSALAVDRSDWDDPDYMFLAFVGDDRPGRACRDEPGEGVD
jgi:hypothetical protein